MYPSWVRITIRITIRVRIWIRLSIRVTVTVWVWVGIAIELVIFSPSTRSDAVNVRLASTVSTVLPPMRFKVPSPELSLSALITNDLNSSPYASDSRFAKISIPDPA